MGGSCNTNGDENAYKSVVGKPERKRSLGRPRRRWVDIIRKKGVSDVQEVYSAFTFRVEFRRVGDCSRILLSHFSLPLVCVGTRPYTLTITSTAYFNSVDGGGMCFRNVGIIFHICTVQNPKYFTKYQIYECLNLKFHSPPLRCPLYPHGMVHK
jgi:hypothetical protein